MTDSDVDVMEATSEYGSGEQQHVSDGSEEEASDGSDNDGEEEEYDDYGEAGEVMEDAFATKDSDSVREEGNALFIEKKVEIFFDETLCQLFWLG